MATTTTTTTTTTDAEALKAEAEVKRAQLHDRALPLIVKAAKADDAATVNLTPLYLQVAPLVVDLRESFVPKGTLPTPEAAAKAQAAGDAAILKAAREAVAKAVRTAQYRTSYRSWLNEAIAEALEIPEAPEAPEAIAALPEDADEKAQKAHVRIAKAHEKAVAEHAKAVAAWELDTAPLYLRRTQLEKILPLRLQLHVENEIARRYGKAVPSTDDTGNGTDDDGREAAQKLNSPEAKIFAAMAAGREVPEADVPLVEASRRILQGLVAMRKAVEVQKESGIAGMDAIYKLSRQSATVALSIADSIARSLPKAEADELRSEAILAEKAAKAEAEQQAAEAAEALKAEAAAKAEAEVKAAA